MKVSKNKKNKRNVEFYKTLYNLIEPYRVLVDGSFVFAALKNRIHVREQLPALLGASAVPYTTNCILTELRNMGDDLSGAATIVKHYQKLKCFHKTDDKICNSRRCIVSAVGNGNAEKLFVASQDNTLISWLRKMGGIPIIKLNNNVPFLEKPSICTINRRQKIEESKKGPKDWEKQFLTELNKEPVVKRKKKKKNPNPLSCLKKKVKVENKKRVDTNDKVRSRRRRRKRDQPATTETSQN